MMVINTTMPNPIARPEDLIAQGTAKRDDPIMVFQMAMMVTMLD